MTTEIDKPFTQVSEIWAALLAGKKVKYQDRPEYFFMEHGDVFYKNGMTGPVGFTNPEDYSIYQESHWYDNIPEQGILCEASNRPFGAAPIKIKVVMLQRTESGFFMDVRGYIYRYAVPLTKEQALELVYKGDSE
jgi:hypothetical protein